MYKMIFSIGEAWSQSLSKLSKLRKRLLVRKRLLWKRCRPRQSLLPKLLLEICPILLQSPRLPHRCRQVSCRRPRLTRSSGMSCRQRSESNSSSVFGGFVEWIQ